jgi:hypothetical protein
MSEEEEQRVGAEEQPKIIKKFAGGMAVSSCIRT